MVDEDRGSGRERADTTNETRPVRVSLLSASCAFSEPVNRRYRGRGRSWQVHRALRRADIPGSRTLGVVTFDTTLFGPVSMLHGLEAAAREAGLHLSIASVGSLARPALLDAIGWLQALAVRGVVAVVPTDSSLAALSEVPGHIALVGICAGTSIDVPTVGTDNLSGAMAATIHLLQSGHRTVHHIAGPPEWPEARQRMAGWRSALFSAEAYVPEPLVGDWSPQAGYALARRLVGDPAVTAIFCANDHMAIGVLRALSEAGRRVPDDVSVVGFDDIPEASFVTPPLTTVQQDFVELGRRSSQLLRDLARGERSKDQIRLTPQLKVRDSAG